MTPRKPPLTGAFSPPASGPRTSVIAPTGDTTMETGDDGGDHVTSTLTRHHRELLAPDELGCDVRNQTRLSS